MEKYIEMLEEENKRLRFGNRNTIRLKCIFNASIYEIDTQIKKKLEEDKIYYLADDNKEPTKVKFMNYEINKSMNTDFIIVANCLNLNNNKFEYYFESSLYSSKNKACDAYLERKYGK